MGVASGTRSMPQNALEGVPITEPSIRSIEWGLDPRRSSSPPSPSKPTRLPRTARLPGLFRDSRMSGGIFIELGPDRPLEQPHPATLTEPAAAGSGPARSPSRISAPADSARAAKAHADPRALVHRLALRSWFSPTTRIRGSSQIFVRPTPVFAGNFATGGQEQEGFAARLLGVPYCFGQIPSRSTNIGKLK